MRCKYYTKINPQCQEKCFTVNTCEYDNVLMDLQLQDY